MTIYTWLAQEQKQYWNFVQYCVNHNLEHERKEIQDRLGNDISYVVVTKI